MSESVGENRPIRIGVLTSGGDAQGMNAAVRAVVRSGIHAGVEVFAIREGWQGAIDGTGISRLEWEDVGSILNKGGTVIGTARAPRFREWEGRREAARHLVEHGIDRVIVIGGDGSLTGADELRTDWPALLAELVERGELTADQVAAHEKLFIVGLVGSIDNDMVGTDMTIGADSALHRITEAIDAIASTAASHQRNFVIEVMGRRCGYLALMGAVAGGADYALFPEHPPAEGWEQRMCELLDRGRAAGRRDSIVVVAEGAQDRNGNPITSDQVRTILREHTGEDARVTVLGHVQRGGTPSAYDRWMATMLGVAAVDEVLAAQPDSAPQVIGVHANRVVRRDLAEAVQETRSVGKLLAEGRYDEAMAKRSSSFTRMVQVFHAITEAEPQSVNPDHTHRIGVLHCGGLAPGMNSAAKAVVRLGLDRGHTMLGVVGGFHGLAEQDVRHLGWGDVEGWTAFGGAELGARREVPTEEMLYSIGRTIEQQGIDALVVIGGFDAYEAVALLEQERRRYPALRIPIVCLPASIDNNLPGWQMAVGADTALNVITGMVDQLKQSASAAKRCFVVETMGRYCGFLALVSGIASGAERVYLHEDGISLASLAEDVDEMRRAFEGGRRFYLAIRNEEASRDYTTDFLARLFEAEGGDAFDVRTAVLGHVQQGGNPTPFDRIIATRLAAGVIEEVSSQLEDGRAEMVYAVDDDETPAVHFRSVKHMDDDIDWQFRRSADQWWMQLRPVMEKLSWHPGR